MKKAISIVLAAVLMFSLLSLGAGAADFKDNDEILNQKAVQTAVSLNIISGRDDGSYFDPAKIVTRAEMCKMICIALNGGNEPTLGTKDVPTYTDIGGHWAAGYIEYCTGLGIVEGMGDGTFAPDAPITGTEAAKMLLVALGYLADYEGFNGTDWAVKVNALAMAKGLYDGLNIKPNAGLSRDNAAQMVYNALYAKMVTYDYGIAPGKAVAVETTDTILTKYYKLNDETVGILSSISYDAGDGYYRCDILTSPQREFGDTTGKDEISRFYSKTDYSELMGMSCQVFWKDKNRNNGGFIKSEDTLYDIIPSGSKLIAKGNTGLVGIDQGVGDDKKITFGLTKFNLDDFTAPDPAVYTPLMPLPEPLPNFWYMPVYYFNFCNQQQAILGDLLDQWPGADLTLLDNDGNGKVDCAVATPFGSYKVTGVSTGSFSINEAVSGMNGRTVSLAEADSYDGIARGDYVRVYEAKYCPSGKMTVTKENIITGTVVSDTTPGSGDRAGRVYNAQVNGMGLKTWHYLAPGVSGVIKGDTVEYIISGAYFLFTKIQDTSWSSNKVCYVNYAGTKTDNSTGVTAWFIDDAVVTGVKPYRAGSYGSFTVVDPPEDISTLIGLNRFELVKQNGSTGFIRLAPYTPQEGAAELYAAMTEKTAVISATGLKDAPAASEDAKLHVHRGGTTFDHYSSLANFPAINHGCSIVDAAFYRVTDGKLTDILLINRVDFTGGTTVTRTIYGYAHLGDEGKILVCEADPLTGIPLAGDNEYVEYESNVGLPEGRESFKITLSNNVIIAIEPWEYPQQPQ